MTRIEATSGEIEYERIAGFYVISYFVLLDLNKFMHNLLTLFASAMIVRIGGLPRELGSSVASAT
jgi:hypothetical protein